MIEEYKIDYAILSNRIHPSSSTFIDSFWFRDRLPTILFIGPQIEKLDRTLLSTIAYFLRFCVIVLERFTEDETIPEKIELQYDELEKCFHNTESKR